MGGAGENQEPFFKAALETKIENHCTKGMVKPHDGKNLGLSTLYGENPPTDNTHMYIFDMHLIVNERETSSVF